APQSQLAVSADGKEIIAVGGDLTVRRFDARTGALRSIRQLPRASGALRYGTWLSPRGTFALAAGIKEAGKNFMDLWDLSKEKIQGTLSLSYSFRRGAAFSADECRLAVADDDPQTLRVLLCDLQTSKSKVLWSEKKNNPQYYFEPVVVFSPDGKRLIACHY